VKGFKGQAFDKLCSLMKKEGYATTYAITGEAIRELQNKAARNGRKLVTSILTLAQWVSRQGRFSKRD